MPRFERNAAIVLAVSASIAIGGCIGQRVGGPGSRASSPTPAPATGSNAPSSSPGPIASGSSEPEPSPSEEMTGTEGPGCGTGQKGFFAHRDQIQATLTLDGTPIELTPAHVAMRDGSYDADDAIPEFVGLTEDEAAVDEVREGKLVLVGKGMTLSDLTVGTVPWSTVDFSQEPSTSATPKTASWHVASNGRIVIIAPSRAGEYLLLMKVTWQTECLEGDGTAYGRIVVG